MRGIHHPEGGKKAISIGGFALNTNPYFWRIEWDSDTNIGPTAPGSSGSPLFTNVINGIRVIGDLSYGSSTCSNIDGLDRYGKLRAQWDDPGGADKRLKDWLDPNDNDATMIDGRDPCFDNLVINSRTFQPVSQYHHNNFAKVQAGQTINITNSEILNNSVYTFTAGQTITISPGFETGTNTVFEAKIQGCQ